MALFGSVKPVMPHRNVSPGGGVTILPLMSVPSQKAVYVPRPKGLRSKRPTTSSTRLKRRMETVTSEARVSVKSTFRKLSSKGLNGQSKQDEPPVVDMFHDGLKN